MRKELINEISRLAHNDDRIVLLTADLGFGVVDEFKVQHPDRFFNVGVAEQGMIALATGLARDGFTPYCYSIATFASLRGLEFVRNGPVVHQLPVRIIGVGPGFDYSNDGVTHFAVDDLAVLRIQPGLRIWAPSTTEEVYSQLPEVQAYSGPVYLRIPRHETVNNGQNKRLEVSSPEVLIACLGDAVDDGKQIADELAAIGRSSKLVKLSWLHQDAVHKLIRESAEFAALITVETHYVSGGFGSLVAEEMVKEDRQVPLFVAGIERLPIGELGNRAFLNRQFFTSPPAIAQRVHEKLSKSKISR